MHTTETLITMGTLQTRTPSYVVTEKMMIVDRSLAARHLVTDGPSYLAVELADVWRKKRMRRLKRKRRAQKK
ncbi:hypothetical protein DICVIV_07362 [Dictyocaulus viviparus]|uniref:60S ribosomal protein L41 n=1 Tax=Dictyocaulus viviparus TaxID=29172 RepID=A0A0D8XS43_DICVI|nr:hypothetical protein DICVIV_07362 [Dictyocaulus viviparus]